MSAEEMRDLLSALEVSYQDAGSEALMRLHTFCYGYMEHTLTHLKCSGPASKSALDVLLRLATFLLRRTGMASVGAETKFVLNVLHSRFMLKTLPSAIREQQLGTAVVDLVMSFALAVVQAFPRQIFLCKALLLSCTEFRMQRAESAQPQLLRSLVDPLVIAINALSDGIAIDEGFSSFASWKQMPLVPKVLSEDLTDVEDLPKVEWLYNNFEEYMDTYFRLLRADCFGSLQSGIKAFVQGNLDPRDLRVYHAEIVAVHILRNAKGFVASVACENYFNSRVRFPPRALMQSNLVCLSMGTQPFAEVLWGRIVERPSGRQAPGSTQLEVAVEFLEELNHIHGFELLSRLLAPKVAAGGLLLVDNPVFYLSFGPVLQKLRSLTAETMPLGTKLFGRDADAKAAAKDLPWTDHGIRSLKDVIDRGERVFDVAQGEALPLMLGSAVSCIQGPPGTGKSFIGVEVTRHLLRTPHGVVPPLMSQRSLLPYRRNPYRSDDSDSDRSFDRGLGLEVSEDDGFDSDGQASDQKMRVLVLTYKNHALDEFLVDCLKQIHPQPQVIRIGGRCDNEELQTRNLGMMAKSRKKSHSIGKMLHQKFTKKDDLTEKMRAAMSELSWRLDPAALCAEHASAEQLLSLVGGCPLNCRKPHARHHARLQDAIVNNGRVAADDLRVCFEAWRPSATAPKKQRLGAGVQNDDDEASDVEGELEASERRCFEEVPERLCSLKLAECLGGVPFAAPADGGNMTRLAYCEDLWALDSTDRSQLLGAWLQQEVASFREHFGPLLEENDTLAQEIQQLNRAHQVAVLREADIVGCTISGASIRCELLSEVNFPVVIVEEAAEILEPQLIAAIPPSCRQLIMIGDHFQLKPKVENHRLGRDLHFDRSLMERLLLRPGARYPQVSLTTQNRMRQEFLCMLLPIYPQLETNLERVRQNKPLSVVDKTMFFVTTQQHLESESKVGRSVMNSGEASIIMQFLHLILREGYEQKSVTVLGMYDGQVALLRGLLRDAGYPDVHVCTVDSYQGDENQFVLVSLVRSNASGKIGFVAERSRLIVAASRARSGVYFFGNAELLQAKSKDWRQLIGALRAKNCFGSELPLICPRHPDVRLKLGQSCHHVCNARLACGHRCSLACHRDGSHPRCEEEASVALSCGHEKACRCWEVEKNDHLKCSVVVKFAHEVCRHEDARKCSEKAKPCTVVVHMQCAKCREYGEAQCVVKTHKPEEYRCQKPCPRAMSCSHPCTLQCFEDCEKGLDDCELCAQERERVSSFKMEEVRRRLDLVSKDDHVELSEVDPEAASHEFSEVQLQISTYFRPVGLHGTVVSMQKVQNNDLERQFYRQHEFLSSSACEKLMCTEVRSWNEATRVAHKGLACGGTIGQAEGKHKGGKKRAPVQASHCDLFESSNLDASKVKSEGAEVYLLLCRVQRGRVYEIGRTGHRLKWGDKVPEDFDSSYNSETACLRLTRVALALPTHVLRVQVKVLPPETSFAFAQPEYWSSASAHGDSRSGRPWSVVPVSQKEADALRRALAPGGSLGGRDQRTELDYRGFSYAQAWRLEHPGMWCEYAAAKQHIHLQLPSLAKAGLRLHPVKLRAAYEELAQQMPAQLDSEINEVYLSHGTKPETIVALMSEGLNERFSGGLFGHGTYLAEDVAKNDNYVTYDEHYGAHKELHNMLFDKFGLKHPGKLLYVFFCRTALGCAVRTKDGMTDMDGRGRSVWSCEQKELATIAGSNPPILHHSLLAETGERIKRYREFILFHGNRLYPEYLVAYQRR